VEDANEARDLRIVEELRKGVHELVRVLAKLEGIEGVVEPSETDDV
jgi:hypothetical protein